MNTVEYIIVAIITILALFLIIRMIVKIAKGESPCMFCKSCGDETNENSSCGTVKEDESSCGTCKVQDEETKND